MIKYAASYRWTPKIDVVVVTAESDVYVTLQNGRRRQKVTGDEVYFDSWEEAHAWLMSKAEKEVADARGALQRARDRMGNVTGMKRPS